MKRFLKSSLSLVLALTIILSSALVGLGEIDFGSHFAIKAEAASVDDLTFELNDDGQSYSVTGCDESVSGELIISSTYNGLPVTSIGYEAFLWCESLTSVTIPDSVTSIGEDAFRSCTSLTSITIPDSVTSIGERVFYGCGSLTSIDVDANNIYYSSVKGVLFNKDKTVLTRYPEGKVDNEYIIPASVTNISDSAFLGCDSLTSIIIPDSVTSIGKSAFKDCTSLTSVKIGNGLTSIGKYAFRSCTSLTSITIPDSVTSIGDYAFSYCTSLTSVKIGNGLTSIGDNTFEGCTSLTSITIPDSVTSIGEWAFEECTNLTSITIPDSVTSIDCGAFYDCTSLTSVKIGNGLTSIGDYTLEGCTSLTSVTIPNSVTSIGEDALGYYYDNDSDEMNKVDGFTIQGYKGSAAEAYAIENGFTFIDVLHTHTSSDWITDKEATVSAAGSKHMECTVCGITLKTEKIPQLTCSAPKLTKVESTGSGVKITWGKTAGADSYIVYRKTYSGGKWSGWSKIKTGATGTSYTDATAKSGVYYIYTVRGVNEAGKGSYNSAGLKIKFLSTPKLSSISNGSGKVTVKWSKVTGASNYTVYRKTYSNGKWSGWSKIGTTKNTYYNDTKVSSGKYYKYTVRATNGDYKGSYNSTGLKIKYLAVASLKSAVSQKAGVKVTWGKVTGAKGYEVYRRTYSNGKWTGWTKIKTVSSGSTVSYTDKSAKKGVTYKYTVRAISDSYKGYYKTSGLQVKDKY